MEAGLRQGRCTLWRLRKTAIWFQKCGFTKVLDTFAKLGSRRPPVRPSEAAGQPGPIGMLADLFIVSFRFLNCLVETNLICSQ